MRKKSEIISIKEALAIFLKEKKWDKKIEGYQIISNWEEIVGEELANNTQPIKIENTILWLKVKSNVWANELNWRKGEIIEKINRNTRKTLVTEVIFKVQPSSFKTNI
ncbi:MAG: hypothetical protein Kow00103_10200 [Candidatus Caldatribacteriota bacterium]